MFGARTNILSVIEYLVQCYRYVQVYVCMSIFRTVYTINYRTTLLLKMTSFNQGELIMCVTVTSTTKSFARKKEKKSSFGCREA
jgi:hypothetical protein